MQIDPWALISSHHKSLSQRGGWVACFLVVMRRIFKFELGSAIFTTLILDRRRKGVKQDLHLQSLDSRKRRLIFRYFSYATKPLIPLESTARWSATDDLHGGGSSCAKLTWGQHQTLTKPTVLAVAQTGTSYVRPKVLPAAVAGAECCVFRSFFFVFRNLLTLEWLCSWWIMQMCHLKGPCMLGALGVHFWFKNRAKLVPNVDNLGASYTLTSLSKDAGALERFPLTFTYHVARAKVVEMWLSVVAVCFFILQKGFTMFRMFFVLDWFKTLFSAVIQFTCLMTFRWSQPKHAARVCSRHIDIDSLGPLKHSDIWKLRWKLSACNCGNFIDIVLGFDFNLEWVGPSEVDKLTFHLRTSVARASTHGCFVAKSTAEWQVVIIIAFSSVVEWSSKDAHLRRDLVQKITSLAERFAPDNEWCRSQRLSTPTSKENLSIYIYMYIYMHPMCCCVAWELWA